MEYLGVVGTEDYAYVLVRKWMPGWYQWAESKFEVVADHEIGGPASVVEEEAPKGRAAEAAVPRGRGARGPGAARGQRGQRGGAREPVAPAPPVDEQPKQKANVDFSTGCFSAKHELRQWLDIRDPAGVVRRLLLVGSGAPRAAKINDCKDPQPEPELTLESAVSAPTRMVGRENARYINVGFRCVKALWPLTPPVAEQPKTPAQ
jgi:hypothetical protein